MERYHNIMLLMLLLTLHSACDIDAIRKIAGIPEKVNKTVNAIDSTTAQISKVLSEYTEIFGEAQHTHYQREIDSVFTVFRQAMLHADSEQLAGISRLPLEGDCGFDLGIQQQVSIWLNATDLQVLELMSASGIEQDSCLHKSRFSIPGKDSFTWSVGCMHSAVADGGEYAVTFWFSRFDGKLLLYKITCTD